MESPSSESNPWLFGLTVTVLSAAIVVGPLLVGQALSLDPRTPSDVSHDALYQNYGLVSVSQDDHPLPEGQYETSKSQYDPTSGATTTDVPFFLDDKLVTCTVHVPDDPTKTTADCRR